MCCFLPCVRWIQKHVDNEVICTVIVTEIFRWITIAIPVYLSVWRFAAVSGHTIFIPNVDETTQYWGVVTAIFVGVSLMVYLPIKILTSVYLKNARFQYGWRPSIVTYIFCCALPCIILITVAVDREDPNETVMTSINTVALQVTVLGLTVTEWMAKMREEVMTFDLIGAMATDFFFAYDVIDFFMLSAYEEDIYKSSWRYVTFVMGFLAMFKYVPTQPTTLNEYGAPKGAVTCILVSMLCNDIPFVVVRLATMGQFGLHISDLIHPAKNIAMILFGCTQLYIIHHNSKKTKRRAPESQYAEHRCSRHPSFKTDDQPGSVSKNPAGGATEECLCEMEAEIGRSPEDGAARNDSVKERETVRNGDNGSVQGPSVK